MTIFQFPYTLIISKAASKLLEIPKWYIEYSIFCTWKGILPEYIKAIFTCSCIQLCKLKKKYLKYILPHWCGKDKDDDKCCWVDVVERTDSQNMMSSGSSLVKRIKIIKNNTESYQTFSVDKSTGFRLHQCLDMQWKVIHHRYSKPIYSGSSDKATKLYCNIKGRNNV